MNLKDLTGEGTSYILDGVSTLGTVGAAGAGKLLGAAGA